MQTLINRDAVTSVERSKAIGVSFAKSTFNLLENVITITICGVSWSAIAITIYNAFHYLW